MSSTDEILGILDACSEAATFPMLDNGYVYLAATRLSLYRSSAHWAMVIEIFGFSPRAGLPDTHVYTFASAFSERSLRHRFVTPEALERYLAANPHNESLFLHPVDPGPWQSPDNAEWCSEDAGAVSVRGVERRIPASLEFLPLGIDLEHPPRVQVFELCRYLAAVARESVLATPSERQVCLPQGMAPLLQLEEWHHPDLVEGEHPSDSPTFRQLADVLATGNTALYRPLEKPNTHWVHWPDGGLL